ncbi:hypothetical protein BS47DRAFT_1366863 [Hydnum rufescens UP504]|uniref:Insecticide toxin TcdB middle/N-terminal domain-containing protein n=1 Tax=Hydnum rufescens UP504 TaxID=1448309 RepID=A0A9P6AK96_9AGAM|nr:hypothetical protein BS47DRAFT_1366863 [Hydnum rufescens UP504]
MSNTIVGSLAIDHCVDPNGSLFLKVPIQVPPAKLTPDLSISYHSAVHQQSVLGHGCDLHTFGLIQRSARTVAQDGVSGKSIVGSVNYDANDRFTLNGQRLMRVSTPATEYRYEIEQWSKVVASGNAANPSSWTEHLPNGTVRKYGSTTSSNLKAVGRDATRIWALAEEEDPFSNYVSWTYAPADADGALILNTIEYGGNKKLHMAHQRKLTFSYETRLDIETEYLGGSHIRSTKRLLSVEAFFSNNLLHTHKFGYDYAPVTGFTRLKTITLSDPFGAVVSPLQFNWANSNPTVFNQLLSETTLDHDVSSVRLFPADVDGSGRTGVILSSKKSNKLAVDVHLADGQGGVSSNPASSVTTDLRFPDYLLALDVDGDGKTDLVHGVKDYTGDHTLTVLLSKPTGYVPQTKNTKWSPAVPTGVYYSGDFQGNGYVGLVYLYNRGSDNEVCLVQFTSNGTVFTKRDVVYGPKGVDLRSAQPHDGILKYRCDLIPRTSADIMHTESTGFVALPEPDGKTGLLLLRENTNGELEFQTIRSTGQSFAVAEIKSSGILYRGDINLCRTTSMNSLTLVNTFQGIAGTEVSVLQFRNDTFEKVAGVTQPGRRFDGYEVDFGDVRGIGRADCLFSIYNTGTNQVKLSILPCGGSAAAPADFITGYTGGLGATLAVLYAPLTDCTVYGGSGSANPYVNALSGSASLHMSVGLSNARADAPSSVMGTSRTQLIQFPKYVVKELSECALPSTQPNIVNRSEYFYKNGRVAFDGRGWIGFESIAQRSYVLGTTTANTYRQDFPFLGQILKTEIKETSTSNPLKTTAYTLVDQAMNSVHRVTIPTIRQTSYEGGRMAHSVDVAHEYDSYSNITKTTITSVGKTPLVVTKTYSNDTSKWIIGNNLSESITSTGIRMKETRLTYLPDKQVVNKVEEWISGTSFSVKDLQYDDYGNVITELGPWEAKRTFDYDSTYSFPITVTDFANDQFTLQTSALYDYAVGQPKYIKEQNGYIKTQKFDVLGRLIEVSEGESSSALTVIDKREYKRLGNDHVCVRSTLSNKTSNSWSRETRYLDGMERPWKTTVPNVSDPSVTVCNEILLDGIGRVTRRYRSYLSSTPIDSRGYSYYTYDSFSRETKVVTPAATDGTQPVTITSAYSYANNQMTIDQTKTGDGESSSTKTVLEYFPDPDTAEDFVVPLAVSSVDEINQTINTEFDALHRVVSVKDPNDVHLTMEWDGLFRMTSRKLANPSTISPPIINNFTIAYDDALRKTTITNHLTKSSTILVKDRIERTTKRMTSDGEVVDLVYDDPQACAQGQLSSVRSSNGVIEVFTYDARGEEKTSALTVDGQTFTTSFEYTTSRHVSKITNPDNSILTTQFFNDSDIVSGVRLQNEDTTVSSTFSGFNNAFLTPLVSTLGNGLKSTVTLAENGVPVKSVISNSFNTVLHQQTWRLNSLGRLSAYNPSSAANTERLFRYDLAGQLLRSESTERTSAYTYDKCGNLLSKGGSLQVNNGWQLASVKDSTTLVTSRTFEYSADGHRTKELDGSGQPARSMGYDTLGRMTNLNTNRTFVYDSNGCMVKATAPDGTVTYYPSETYEVTTRGGIKTHISYLIHQTRHASITTETGKSPSALYYQCDHLESVVAVFDAKGAVTTEYSYDEFGATTVTRGEDVSRYKFSGKEEFDGLYYFGARFYDPATGRFTTLDDITSSLKDINPPTFNQYTFARNDPVNYIDLNGNKAFWWHFLWHLVADVVLIAAGAALTAFTGGAGFVVGKALIGAGISGLLYDVGAAFDPNQDIGTYNIGWGLNLAVGAIGGAIGAGQASLASYAAKKVASKALSKVVSLGIQVAYGAATGAAKGIASQPAAKGLLSAAGKGAASGAITGIFKGTKAASKKGMERAAKEAAKKVKTKAIKSGARKLGKGLAKEALEQAGLNPFASNSGHDVQDNIRNASQSLMGKTLRFENPILGPTNSLI